MGTLQSLSVFMHSHAYAQGSQFSGGRSKVGSRSPRKIGMVVLHILELLEWGVPKIGGADFFCDTGD